MKHQATIREAVGVFKDQKDLDSAVAELETRFSRQDISVLAGERAVERAFGRKTVKPSAVEDNPDAPRTVPILPEERTIGKAVLVGGPAYVGGCLAAIVANSASNAALLASIAAGSLAGAAFGAAAVVLISSRLRKTVREQIRKGGLVVWVRTPNKMSEKQACGILEKYGGRHIHIHDIS